MSDGCVIALWSNSARSTPAAEPPEGGAERQSPLLFDETIDAESILGIFSFLGLAFTPPA